MEKHKEKPVEIELKARVDCPEDCKKRLISLAGEGTAFSKDDVYWIIPDIVLQLRQSPLSGTFSGLRVRWERAGENTYTWITWKNKKRQCGIEVNEEHEVEIKGGADVEELLALLGLEKKISKRKQGWSWHYNGITAELCKVNGLRNLGWFLELEILAKEDSVETVTAAKEQLLALLGKTGIEETKIESRYYTELMTDA